MARVVGSTALTASTAASPKTMARLAARTRIRYAAWATCASASAVSLSNAGKDGRVGGSAGERSVNGDYCGAMRIMRSPDPLLVVR